MSAHITHLPGDGGLFGSGALCGTPVEPGRVLRMSVVLDEIDCVVCLGLVPTEERTCSTCGRPHHADIPEDRCE